MEVLRIFWVVAYLVLFYTCVLNVVYHYVSFTLAEKLTLGLLIGGFHLISTLISSSKEL